MSIRIKVTLCQDDPFDRILIDQLASATNKAKTLKYLAVQGLKQQQLPQPAPMQALQKIAPSPPPMPEPKVKRHPTGYQDRNLTVIGIDEFFQ